MKKLIKTKKKYDNSIVAKNKGIKKINFYLSAVHCPEFSIKQERRIASEILSLRTVETRVLGPPVLAINLGQTYQEMRSGTIK